MTAKFEFPSRRVTKLNVPLLKVLKEEPGCVGGLLAGRSFGRGALLGVARACI